MRWTIATALLLSPIALPVSAQVVQGVSQTSPSGDTTTTFTITPSSGISASDYVKLSADALNYQIAATTLAQTRAQRDDVKAFAKQLWTHATDEQKTLMASLSNADRKITRPATALSSQRASDVELLRKAPKGSFDTLFLSQHIDRAPAIWALQKGYSVDGTDPALKQVATAGVAPIEQDYQAAKALVPAGAPAAQ